MKAVFILTLVLGSFGAKAIESQEVKVGEVQRRAEIRPSYKDSSETQDVRISEERRRAKSMERDFRHEKEAKKSLGHVK